MNELFRMDRQNYDPDGPVYERPSSRGIILKDGKVLVNYIRKWDCYEFPGGGLEPGETPEQALVREIAEETGCVVRPESIEEFGVVIRRQQDSMDPQGIFEQKNYYYLCDIEDRVVERKPDPHEVEEGAEPVWVEALSHMVYKTRKAFERYGEAHMEREMRVMDMADRFLRRRSYERTEAAAIRALGTVDYTGMLRFVQEMLEDKQTEGLGHVGVHKLEFGYTRYEHTKRVLGWAKRLYDATPDKTGLRYEDLMIATIFHDIGRATSDSLGVDHATAGVPITRQYLLDHGFSQERVEYIASLVGAHSDKFRMKDPTTDRNLVMLMEADLLDDMGLMGLVMDTMIVRGRNEKANFYDCYEHFQRYTHVQQHDCPVVTPQARAFWEEKTAAVDRFMELYRRDILIGSEDYEGYQ